MSGYHFLSWSYPTVFDFGYLTKSHRRFWVDDPTIQTIGLGLRTLLREQTQDVGRLILVGHSMGGLVVQAFVLEELLRNERRHLDRLTEVVLYGTPSGGLPIARLAAPFKNQIADMSDVGPFIEKLRDEWQRLVDDKRSDPERLATFRLTLVAGMKDSFVPITSSQDPFKFDEKEVVPGDHTSMVKPESKNDIRYRILKTRLLRGSPTREQRKLIWGESEEALQLMCRIEAAVNLDAVDDLQIIADDLLSHMPPTAPKVERELGLRLLDFEQYTKADRLLKRYLTFQMPDDQSMPFYEDIQAWQQRAIALCGLGDIPSATALLIELDKKTGKDSETQGILAGRFKRQWLKSPDEAMSIGWRAFNLYMEAFQLAEQEHNVDQRMYNGINAAYLNFVLGGIEFEDMAQRVLIACSQKELVNYWCLATKGEAYLLIGDEPNALAAYKESMRLAPIPRYIRTTGQQALYILSKRDDSPTTTAIKTLFDRITFTL